MSAVGAVALPPLPVTRSIARLLLCSAAPAKRASEIVEASFGLLPQSPEQGRERLSEELLAGLDALVKCVGGGGPAEAH